MNGILKYWPILLPIAVGLIALGGMQYQVNAQADSHDILGERVATIAEGIEQLQDIHLEEDAEERGKIKARREFCREGKLPDSECWEYRHD